MVAATVGLDALGAQAPAHADDDRARQQGVGQPAQPGHRHRRIDRRVFRRDIRAVHDAAPIGRAAPVTGIDEASNVLVLFGLRSEDRIDLVKGDCGLTLVAARFSE